MPNAKIDRLSVVGKWSKGVDRYEQARAILDLKSWLHDLRHREVLDEQEGPKRMPVPFGYWDGVSAGGVHFSWGDPEGKLPPARVEFNPNTARTEVLAALSFLDPRSVRVSRVDVALDYDGLNLGTYRWLIPRLKQVQWATAAGEKETQYLGSQKSLRSFRIYDKAKEHGVTDGQEWWRCELQQRYRPSIPHTVLDPAHFDGLGAYRTPVEGLTLNDRLRVFYVCNGGDLSEFDKGTKRRILDLVKDRAERLDPLPADVYRECRSELVESVNGLVPGLALR